MRDTNTANHVKSCLYRQLQSDVEQLKQQQQEQEAEMLAGADESLSDGDDTCPRCHKKVYDKPECRCLLTSILTSTSFTWICILCYKEMWASYCIRYSTFIAI